MTREEAIAIFRGFKFLPREMEAVDMAIKALEKEPCEDAVSRQAVINAIANTCFWLSNDNWKELTKCINSISPVTPQQTKKLAEYLWEEPKTWSLDDAREDFVFDVYNILDFLPTNNEANQIIDVFDRVTSGLEQEPILDKIRADITDWQTDIHDNEYDAEAHDFVFERIYEIIDEYVAESEE